MTNSPEPIDPRHLRVSDDEREAVAERLRVAAGDGRIGLDELDERIGAVYEAKTYAELEPITRDLPATTGAGAFPAPASASASRSRFRIGGTPSRRRSIVVMGGTENRGQWVVPRRYTAFAWMGGIELDLREAQFEDREVTIVASCWMGGIDIIVPEGLNVQVHGVGFMGGYSGSPAGEVVADGPVVHVKGFAFMGGVSIRRRPPRKPTDKARKDSNELRGESRRELAD